MPCLRNITVGLVSALGVQEIPELVQDVPSLLGGIEDPFSPTPTTANYINHDAHRVSVFVPTYPNSQFWLQYDVDPSEDTAILYYFNLFVNGACVVSWGCGEEDNFEGKTMYGLFKGKDGFNERRVMTFTSERELNPRMRPAVNDVIEVQAFRARARKRVAPTAAVSQHDKDPDGSSDFDACKERGIW
jgi:hypothetical protein